MAALAQKAPSPADAADATPTNVEEVVVTGTSIRGVAPVGSNLIAVGQEELKAAGAQTVQQALANIPALTSFGNVGQGGDVANSFFQPTIHSLGASASNSTLVLIDGHRPPTSGTNHSTADPNILPTNMVQRVEVLADGSSSVYGSDAVAGVVNFITRKSFEGIQLDASTTYTDGGKGYSLGYLSGKTWDTGSVIFAYSYTMQPMIMNSDRSFTNPNHTSQGGTNFQNFNCDPATLQPGGSGVIYTSATSGKSVTNSSANGFCSSWADTSLISQEVRNNVMAKVSQQFGDNLTIGGEVLYASRRDKSLVSAGTLTATAFATGPQANPFYKSPVGYTGTATSETVRWDATELFGPATSMDKSDTMYADITGEYRLGDNIVLNALVVAGRDDSIGNDFTGTINTSVADLALNGTTNSAGNRTLESVPGTGIAVTKLPLTTANALDVWNPAATNQTSAAVRSALLDNYTYRQIVSTFQQFRVSGNGTLFQLPAGPLRAALGVELFRTQWTEFLRRSNNTGPASQGTSVLDYVFHRDVTSVFGELDMPLIGESMNIPLVKTFGLNASARYDKYSDFGKTINPKLAFSWDVVSGIRLRGNISSSFVAPGLDIVGDPNGGYLGAMWGAFTNNINVPVSAYPNLVKMGIPGCTATSTTCNIASLQGLQTNQGDPNAKAQKGKGWSLGVDYTPDYLPGFRAQLTWWNTQFIGGVTGPVITNAVSAPALQKLLTFYPGGATPQEIAAATAGKPQATTLPSEVDYIYQKVNSNWLNIFVQGIDASADYTYRTDTMGNFVTGLTLSHFLKFKQQYGDAPVYDILNTSGANSSYPSIATQARVRLGWNTDRMSATFFTNIVPGYRNWSGTSVTPIVPNSDGNPGSGGDKVKTSVTYDLNLSYTFNPDGLLKGADASLTIRDLFNTEPPFYNSSSGYDPFSGNPVGRRITASLTKKFF